MLLQWKSFFQRQSSKVSFEWQMRDSVPQAREIAILTAAAHFSREPEKGALKPGWASSVDAQPLWRGQNKATPCSCPRKWKYCWLLQRLPAKLRQPTGLFRFISWPFQNIQEEEIDTGRQAIHTEPVAKTKQKKNHSDTQMAIQCVEFSAQLAKIIFSGNQG